MKIFKEDKNKFYKIDGELNFIIQMIASNIYNDEVIEAYANCGRLMQKLINYEITEIE